MEGAESTAIDVIVFVGGWKDTASRKVGHRNEIFSSFLFFASVVSDANNGLFAGVPCHIYSTEAIE